MKKIRIATAVCIVLLLAAVTAFAAIHYFQGFEVDTYDWTGVTRVSSGTNGVISAAGNYHAEAAPGAFTRFGGYESTFPDGGYTTSIDIYLNMAGGYMNDTRFDYSSAIQQPNGNFLRDFMFNGGFYNDADPTSTLNNTPRFVVSASNNSPGWPKNPGRNPVAITQTGWYTFTHRFYNSNDVLAVDLSITKFDGTPVPGATWTLSTPTDLIGTNVGGHLYGWFVDQQSQPFSVLAIDNVSLLSVNAAASVSACKNGGWQHLTRSDGSIFVNQGDCIQYVNTGK
jgi:hypothetical protein